MRIFTIIFCLFLSMSALGQAKDTAHVDSSKIVSHEKSMPSITKSGKPLLVIEGVVFKGNLKDINPNDIAEVTVLKGNAAIALYGTAAANGVLLISMKESWRIKHKRQPPPKPLFVVDGVIFKGDIRTIDPKTIASSSILRKEYAVPLYGPAGANGAIIITTKSAVRQYKPDTIR